MTISPVSSSQSAAQFEGGLEILGKLLLMYLRLMGLVKAGRVVSGILGKLQCIAGRADFQPAVQAPERGQTALQTGQDLLLIPVDAGIYGEKYTHVHLSVKEPGLVIIVCHQEKARPLQQTVDLGRHIPKIDGRAQNSTSADRMFSRSGERSSFR